MRHAAFRLLCLLLLLTAATIDTKRSLIQVAELHYHDGQLTADRDQPVYLDLRPGKSGKPAKPRLSAK